MHNFTEKLKLKGMAEEDIYFAKRDLELIEALRRKRLKDHVKCPSDKSADHARVYEKKFRKVTRKHRDDPGALLEAYRKLVREIRKRCTQINLH